MQKKNCPKNEKLYIFEKPLTMPFQICKKFCKIINNLKMFKFPLTDCLQIIFKNFFAKIVQSVSLCHRLKVIKIWQLKVGQNKDLVCYWKKESFRQLKSPVLDLKGGLWVFRKSQKILTASDQYFLSCVKKTKGGGGSNCPPPPAGIGLKIATNSYFSNLYVFEVSWWETFAFN